MIVEPEEEGVGASDDRRWWRCGWWWRRGGVVAPPASRGRMVAGPMTGGGVSIPMGLVWAGERAGAVGWWAARQRGSRRPGWWRWRWGWCLAGQEEISPD
jgi:hypothetical protein